MFGRPVKEMTMSKGRRRVLFVASLIAVGSLIWGWRSGAFWDRSWRPADSLGAKDPGRSAAKRDETRVFEAHRKADAANLLREEWSLDGPPSAAVLTALEQAKPLAKLAVDASPSTLGVVLSLADPSENGEHYAQCGPVYAPGEGSCHLTVTTVLGPAEDGAFSVVRYARAEVHAESAPGCRQYAACLSREMLGRLHPALDAGEDLMATQQTFTAGPWAARMELDPTALEQCIALYREQVDAAKAMADAPPADMPDFEFVAGLMELQLAYCEAQLEALG